MGNVVTVRKIISGIIGLVLLMGMLFGCSDADKPLVLLTAPVVSGPAPLDVSFDLSHSEVPGNTPLQYTLNFGDGTTPVTGSDLDLIVHHTYEVAGTFTARLTVTDADGHRGESSLVITVSNDEPPVGTSVGMTAPDFTAHTTDGGEITLSDYRGQVVILEFWGAWCAPCKASMPHLQDLYERYHSRGLVVIAVSTDQEEQDTIDFLNENGYTDFISVWEPGGKHESPITKLYGVDSSFVGIPRTYVLDRQGIIRYVGHPMNLTDEFIQGLL